MKRKVSVSFLASEDKENAIMRINSSSADYIHVDVADGVFVSNKAMPFKILDKLSSKYKKRLDVHLMVSDPIKLIEDYASLNTEYITIQVEIKQDINKLLDKIKSYGIKCGLAINPKTDVNLLDQYLDKVDLIIVMSVEAGFSGQAFIDDCVDRAINIKRKLLASKRDIKLSMDGGINGEVAKDLGFIDIIISESYVLKGENIEERIEDLR